MARTTPAQKPRGEHSSTFSAGLGASVMRTSFDAWLRHSTWGYALGLSSESRGTCLRCEHVQQIPLIPAKAGIQDQGTQSPAATKGEHVLSDYQEIIPMRPWPPATRRPATCRSARTNAPCARRRRNARLAPVPDQRL